MAPPEQVRGDNVKDYALDSSTSLRMTISLFILPAIYNMRKGLIIDNLLNYCK